MTLRTTVPQSSGSLLQYYGFFQPKLIFAILRVTGQRVKGVGTAEVGVTSKMAFCTSR